MGPQFFVDGGFVCTYKGITRLLGRGSVRITPAHAGKSQLACLWGRVCQDHPRTRGEKSGDEILMGPVAGSPPHTRGKVKRTTTFWNRKGITPAHAGKSSICPMG